MTLYELTGSYLTVLEMAEDPETDPELIADTLESIEGEIEDKADAYAKVMKTLDAEAVAIKAEIERLQNRKTSIENNSKRIKKSLQDSMVATGKTKFKTTLFSFGIQKNPASVDISNDAEIPNEYYIPQEPKLDKKGLIKAVKDGAEIKGVTLTQGESLRIR